MEFTRDELEQWLNEMLFNNCGTEFEKYILEILNRLDGFEKYVNYKRGAK